MKVYELMQKLSEYPAGAEVVLCQGDTYRTELEVVENDPAGECVAMIGAAIPEGEE